MGFIFNLPVYAFKPPAAPFPIRSAQRIRTVCWKGVCPAWQKWNYSFWINLLSRLIVANWPTGVKTLAQLDVLVVHWLLQGEQGASRALERVWGQQIKTNKIWIRYEGPWLLAGVVQLSLLPCRNSGLLQHFAKSISDRNKALPSFLLLSARHHLLQTPTALLLSPAGKDKPLLLLFKPFGCPHWKAAEVPQAKLHPDSHSHPIIAVWRCAASLTSLGLHFPLKIVH